MKKLVLVLLPLTLSAGCAMGAYPLAAGGYRHRAAYAPRADTPSVAAPLPVGRWDNVMMLEPGTPVKALTADGVVTTGEVVGATIQILRISNDSGEVSLAMTDVTRVDRLAGQGSGGRVREGVKGAAVGAGTVGVLGLIVGHVPPPRMFIAGGIAGAYAGTEVAAVVPGPGTIYLAPSVASGAVRPGS